MDIPSPIGVGIIGCGRIADLHVRGWSRCPQARIVTLCDRSPEVVQRRRQEWGVGRGTTDYRAVLADPEVQLVEILLPHELHRPICVAACEAGKHVSLQKPMAMTIAECDEMIGAARKAGVILRIFENFVHFPPYVKAFDLLRDGAIGTPLSARFKLGVGMKGGWPVPLRSWAWRFDAASCGGGPVLFDDGYHKLSVAMHFFGPVRAVHAWVDRSIGALDAPALVSWAHEAGCLGHLDATFSPHMALRTDYYPADERVEILGTEGMILLPRCTARLSREPALVLHRKGQTTTFDALRSDWQDSFTDSVLHLVKNLREGGEPLLTGERGRDVLRFGLAIQASARENRSVHLDEIEGTTP